MPEKVSLPARSRPKSGRQEASHELRGKRTPRCAPVPGGSLGTGVWCVWEAGNVSLRPPISIAWQQNTNMHGPCEGVRGSPPVSWSPSRVQRASGIPYAQRKAGDQVHPKDLLTPCDQVVSNASPRSNIPRLHNGHPQQGLGVRPKVATGRLEQRSAPPLGSHGTCHGC